MFHALAAGDRLALAPTLLHESAAGQSIGIIWRFDGHPSDSRLGPDSFASFDEPSHLKARWDVRIEPRAATQTYLSIRTEFIPTDEDARLRLLDAWGIVEPLATAFSRRIARTVTAVSEDRDEEL
jgi:hypothetical protein